MIIDKITPNTPNKYIIDNYLNYYRIDNEHIVIIDNSFGKVFSINTDYETINNYISQHFEICCFDFEDRGEYWEFIEPEEEDYE